MSIRVTCTACGRVFRVEERFAGRTGRCPNAECRAKYRVPEVPLPEISGDSTAASSRKSLRWGKNPQAAPKLQARRTVSAGWIVSLAALGLAVTVAGFTRRPSGNGTTSEHGVALASEVQPTFATHGLPLAKKLCFDCHSGMEPEGGIALDAATDDRALLKSRKLWTRALDLIEQ